MDTVSVDPMAKHQRTDDHSTIPATTFTPALCKASVVDRQVAVTSYPCCFKSVHSCKASERMHQGSQSERSLSPMLKAKGQAYRETDALAAADHKCALAAVLHI